MKTLILFLLSCGAVTLFNFSLFNMDHEHWTFFPVMISEILLMFVLFLWTIFSRLDLWVPDDNDKKMRTKTKPPKPGR